MFTPEANIATENIVMDATQCELCDEVFDDENAYIDHVQQYHQDINIYELDNESAKAIRANIKQQEFQVYINDNSDEGEIITNDEQDLLALEEEPPVASTRTLRSRQSATRTVKPTPPIATKSKRNAKQSGEVSVQPTTSKVIYKTEISDNDESIDIDMDTNDDDYEYQTGSESTTNIYECPMCRIQFMEQEDYVQHCKTEHVTDDTQYQCDSCNEFFISEEQFCQHECEMSDKNDDDDEDLMCSACNKRMKSTSQLRHHKNIHDANSMIIDNTDFFPCHDCCLIFIAKEKLNEHNGKMHTQKVPKELSNLSGKIDESCTDYQFLDGDVQTEYREDEIYSCGECEQSFHTIAELKLHVIMHANKFQCPFEQCGCQYDQMSRLNIHVLNKHINTKNLQCLHCSHPFQTYDELQKHLKDFCKEKKFSCNECGMNCCCWSCLVGEICCVWIFDFHF